MKGILRLPPAAPDCPYCGKASKLAKSAEIYPHSAHDYGWFWLCKPCDAYVGTHSNSRRHAPLGRLANKELREAKKAAHAAFDPLWRESDWSRKDAYNWLTQQMGRVRQVHIGEMDTADCRLIITICEAEK